MNAMNYQARHPISELAECEMNLSDIEHHITDGGAAGEKLRKDKLMVRKSTNVELG